MPQSPTPRIYRQNVPPAWIVTFPMMKNGKIVRGRKSYSLSKEKEAVAHHKRNLDLLPKVGASGIAMDGRARNEFYLIKQLEEKAGITAVELLEQRIFSNPSKKKAEIGPLLEEWLSIKEKSSEPRTIKSRRLRINAWIDECSIATVSDIEAEHTRDYLFGHGWKPVTMIQHASFIRNFCSWLMKSKQCLESNPMDFIELPHVDPTDPRILSVADVKRLFNASKEWPQMIGYFAIGVFAGLRPTEIERIQPGHVFLKTSEPYIRVDKKKRGRGRRTVPIEANLLAWLNAYGLPEYKKWRYECVRDNSGIDWQPDIMRHTYISAQMAITRDPKTVAYWAGNSERIIRSNYLELISEKQAKGIFEIWP